MTVMYYASFLFKLFCLLSNYAYNCNICQKTQLAMLCVYIHFIKIPPPHILEGFLE